MNQELEIIRRDSEALIKELLDKAKIKLDIQIGTMIEVPRAALAHKIAEHADFLALGQMTYATALHLAETMLENSFPTMLKKVYLKQIL